MNEAKSIKDCEIKVEDKKMFSKTFIFRLYRWAVGRVKPKEDVFKRLIIENIILIKQNAVMNTRLNLKQKIGLLLFDGFVFVCLIHFVAWLRLSWTSWFYDSIGLWFIVLSILSTSYIFGSYDIEPMRPFKQLSFRQIFSVIIGLFMVLGVNYLLSKDRSGVFGRGILIGASFSYLLISVIYRYLIWSLLTKVKGQTQVLFLADSSYNSLIKEQIVDKFLLNSKIENGDVALKQVESSIEQASAIIVGLRNWSSELTDVLMKARFNGKDITTLNQFYEDLERKVPVDLLNQEWFVFEKGFELFKNPWGMRIKRLCDLFLALVMLMIIWPVLLIFSILIRLESAGPIFYRQTRTGLNDHEFTIYKLRSMIQDAERSGAQWAKSNDSRITKIGRFIRLTRVDELPQLWNVIKGDMSFIGPRPERPEFNVELEKEIPFYRLRHLVRPGITGWAQVMYPYGASVEDSKQKLQFDLYYIKNFSFALDLIILFRTVRVVLFGKGR